MNWLGAFFSHPVMVISLGGAAGSNARYWLGRLVKELTGPTHFPWSTLLINVSGSIILGIVAGTFKDRHSTPFLLCGVGFCGGYTTFSAFSLEVAEALRDGRWPQAAMYVGTSVIGGMLGFLLALLLAGEPA